MMHQLKLLYVSRPQNFFRCRSVAVKYWQQFCKLESRPYLSKKILITPQDVPHGDKHGDVRHVTVILCNLW